MTLMDTDTRPGTDTGCELQNQNFAKFPWVVHAATYLTSDQAMC